MSSSNNKQLDAIQRRNSSLRTPTEKAVFPDLTPVIEVKPTNERSNVPTNERTFVPTNAKVERRRFSFDIRPELHRQLKMQCLMDDTNMYEVVENLIENYLKDRQKNSGEA